ncbi:MAG TPA: carboxypeptidase regulatory-like domain-containing protein [Silvibacterium sp.]|nr:carboxypeptidase regulatory-like domain-containing protein [Silvibacterium sp.]
MRRLLLALLSVATFAYDGAVFSQAAHQSSGSYSIGGTLISAVTGQPLDRAEVTLHDPTGERLVAETTTGQDGRFNFEHLAAGKYELAASRRGYIGAAYDEHEGYSTAIVTGEGLKNDGIIFRLSPRAVIKGVVSDDAGDPAPQARVSLYRQNQRNGVGNIVRAGVTMTDDTGAYEFARLDAGNYYIAVTATPWYATRPQPRHDAQGNTLPDETRSPLDVAYPTTFYADVTDSDSATPIPVKAGDQVQVNLNLHAVPAVHLSVQVPSPSDRGFAMPQLSQEIFGMSEAAQPSMSYSWRGQGGEVDGQTTVEFTGVAPGQYSVELHGGGDSSRAASIDAASDARIDLSKASDMADVSGKVVMAGGGELPDRLNLSLRTSDGRNGGGDRVNADGTFSLHGVPPGSYEVWVTAADTSLAVAHLTATGAPTEGSVIKIATAPVAISATLASGSATVTGCATRDGKPAPGVMVLLAPRDPGAEREMFRRDQSDSDGSFQLSRVVPGEYTVVAIEDGWTLDWARPGVIAHYLAKGLKVIVPTHTKDFAIKGTIEVQAK